jgi:hypothetical protein
MMVWRRWTGVVQSSLGVAETMLGVAGDGLGSVTKTAAWPEARISVSGDQCRRYRLRRMVRFR